MKEILFVLLSIVLISGCVGEYSSDGVSQNVPAPGFEGEVDEMIVNEEPSIGDETDESPSVKEFTMTAKKFEYNPSEIRVNKGDTVKIAITSMDTTHGFSLPIFGVNKELSSGKTINIEFVADKTGTFTFACSVYCGSGHGRMKGMLIVE